MSAGSLSPLDGRYARQTQAFARAFSEEALVRQRFRVEVEWLLALASEPDITELRPVPEDVEAQIRSWVGLFGASDVARIKEIEGVTNHDVKAVEYFLKEKLASIGFGDGAEFVHFACTSEDINNLAHALMLREGLEEGWYLEADALVGEVWERAVLYASMPMPSHTHGQPASPTTLGKELAVFACRWERQLGGIRSVALSGKFNGAVGTYGAHVAAYPEVDWISLSRRFVEDFGLTWSALTTQIEPHDVLAEVFHGIARFNMILIDFDRDIWEYISRSYLSQRAVAGEVGSSTMPHKVNPIDFENSEANAGISNALLEHLAAKLAVSRMQRDLSDSSGDTKHGPRGGSPGLAVASARRGLAKLSPAPDVMAGELEGQWEVLAEAIQTVMRRYGLPEPYERLKALTRGNVVGADDVHEFISALELPHAARERLLQLSPATYVGLAAELVHLVRSDADAS